jgi:hypothetical protein
VLEDEYNNIDQSFDLDELSILLEAVAVNLDHQAGMVTYLRTVVRGQLGPGQVVVG